MLVKKLVDSSRWWILLVFVLQWRACLSVEIRRLSVPRYVRNGTESAIILDCDYTYTQNDIRLVVKWFFEDHTEPAYQWIPELGVRHTSGVLSGRLDLEYSVSTVDAYSKYRALRIERPTTELSGKYTCLVTSLAGQDSRSQFMTVFVPPTTLDFKLQASSQNLNVSCEATGIFPRPRLELYQIVSHQRSPSVISDVLGSTTNSDHAYNTSLYKYFELEELSSSRTRGFECVLDIPGTDFQRRKRLAYHHPGTSQAWEVYFPRSHSRSRPQRKFHYFDYFCCEKIRKYNCAQNKIFHSCKSLMAFVLSWTFLHLT